MLILDAKDTFSKQRLFQNAWKELYPGMMEWIWLSQGGEVNAVDPEADALITDFGDHAARWPTSFRRSGLAASPNRRRDRRPRLVRDRCRSPESPIIRAEHPCHQGHLPASPAPCPMPRLGENAAQDLRAREVSTLAVGPITGHAKADEYLLQPGGARLRHFGRRRLPAEERTMLADVEGAGGVSPADAPREFRAREADYAQSWFATITAEVFG